jgi:beta-phosphoglucomutase-like phosphatase (HAD superfamily)
LDLAKRERIPVAVATSSDQNYTGFSLSKVGLDRRRFARSITGERVTRGKPAPDIYLEAARQLDQEPSQCRAVEDSDAGILAAGACSTSTSIAKTGSARRVIGTASRPSSCGGDCALAGRARL